MGASNTGQRQVTDTGLPADDREKSIKVEAEAIRLWLKSPATMIATLVLHLATLWALWNIFSARQADRLGRRRHRLVRRALHRVELYYKRRHLERRRKRCGGGGFSPPCWALPALIVSIVAPLVFVPPTAEDRMFLIKAIGGLAAGATAL